MADLTVESLGLPPWARLSEIYAQFEERGSALLEHERYATSSAGLERPEPFWLERAGGSPAQLIDAAPRDPRGAVRYAFPRDDARPMLSELSGADGKPATVWLRWMINRTEFHMRFSLAGSQPALTEVVVERRDERHVPERIMEATAFADGGLRIHREEYRYDASGRLAVIELMDGTPAGIESRAVVDVAFGEEGPTFAERRLLADEELPPASGLVDETKESPLEPPPAPVLAAAEAVVVTLSAAIATWFERAAQSAQITRVLLLHDWPVNPPFPPALVARSGQWSSEDDPYEFFEPESEDDAWFDASPREFLDAGLTANAEILNAWFMDTDSASERSPFELFITVAQTTQREIKQRTGRDLWILPIDYGLEEAGRAVERLLPRKVSGEILKALRGAEFD